MRVNDQLVEELIEVSGDDINVGGMNFLFYLFRFRSRFTGDLL